MLQERNFLIVGDKSPLLSYVKYNINKEFIMDFFKKNNISLFKYIKDEDLAKFRIKPEIRTYKKGEKIFSFGDEPNFMYVIINGIIKISMYLTDGREQVLYTYDEGDFVGAHNLLTNEPYLYESTALSETEVLLISKIDFDNILKKNNEILLKILDQSFKRIRRSEELIDRLVGINADFKVAKVLLDLKDELGEERSDGILIRSHLTREELGSYSGVVRETLSRKLSSFEKMGLIKIIARDKILITNVKALEKITS